MLHSTTAPHIAYVISKRTDGLKMVPLIRALARDGAKASILSCQDKCFSPLDDLAFFIDDIAAIQHHSAPDTTALNTAEKSAALLSFFSRFFHEQAIDILCVHGDTPAAFAATLAAYYHRISHPECPLKVAHLNAGVRTHALYRHAPEEGHRRLMSPLVHWHFTQSDSAEEALMDENIMDRIQFTGSPLIDTLFLTLEQLETGNITPCTHPFPQTLRTLLVHANRKEDDPCYYQNLCHVFDTLLSQHEDVGVFYPIGSSHPQYALLQAFAANHPHRERLHITESLSYPDYVHTLQQAYLVLTDGNTIQEEAPALGKPLLVLRSLTEHTEGVLCGGIKLVGSNPVRILQEANTLLTDEAAYQAMTQKGSPYGDGFATTRIVETLLGEGNASVARIKEDHAA